MFAAIPAPRELYGKVALNNSNPDPRVDIPEAWVLTEDSGLIANAGSAAVLGTNEKDVLESLNRQADVPDGFTQYRQRDHSEWFDDDTKKTPTFKLVDRLWDGRDKNQVKDKDSRNRRIVMFVKTPSLIAGEKLDAINLMSQARVTPTGVRINSQQLRLIFKPDGSNNAAVQYRQVFKNGRYTNDADTWSLKRTAIIDDKYLVRPESDGTYTLAYSLSRVKALKTRRKNNVGIDRKPRKTAYKCMLDIIDVFHTICWVGVMPKAWGFASINYSTRGLDQCAYTIMHYVKFARNISRMGRCRKQYSKHIQEAWYHRYLLTKNTNGEFMHWYWRELKLAGKPADALKFEREQRILKARKAARQAKAQKFLEKVSQFKGQTKENTDVK